MVCQLPISPTVRLSSASGVGGLLPKARSTLRGWIIDAYGREKLRIKTSVPMSCSQIERRHRRRP